MPFIGGWGGNERQASASKSCFHILHPTSAPGCCNSSALTLQSAPSPSQLSSVFNPPLTAALRAMFRRKPIAVGHPDLLQGVLRELSSRRRRHSRLRGRSSAAVPSATTAKNERPRRCAFACLPASPPAGVCPVSLGDEQGLARPPRGRGLEPSPTSSGQRGEQVAELEADADSPPPSPALCALRGDKGEPRKWRERDRQGFVCPAKLG